MAALIVIPADRISDWIRKGEVTSRYYNPGNRFSEIHLFLFNDETPDPHALQRMAGNATISIYRFPTGVRHFIETGGWNPKLLRKWCEPMIKLAEHIRPQLVRCYGAMLNAFVAREIKRRLKIPYVISLHTNFDETIRLRKMGFLRRVRDIRYQRFEDGILQEANLVMPVYLSIVDYLRHHRIDRFEVAYNFLNDTHLLEKGDYTLHSPVRLLGVGRQFDAKNPENIIRALKQIPQASLTLIGDGPYHSFLQRVVTKCGLTTRVQFRKSVPNDELCANLCHFDIFIAHSECWELSKSVLEPLLIGLPVIHNRRVGCPVPELSDEICLFVPNTPEGYAEGIHRMISDSPFREQLGKRALNISRRYWSPELTEAKYASIYDRFLADPGVS